MRRPMLNNSNPGQTVYDPFLGSGTSPIAAETTGRVCLGIEIDPRYVDVAIRRWQAFTGKDARLSGEDQTFAEVEAVRSASEEPSGIEDASPAPSTEARHAATTNAKG